MPKRGKAYGNIQYNWPYRYKMTATKLLLWTLWRMWQDARNFKDLTTAGPGDIARYANYFQSYWWLKRTSCAIHIIDCNPSSFAQFSFRMLLVLHNLSLLTFIWITNNPNVAFMQKMHKPHHYQQRTLPHRSPLWQHEHPQPESWGSHKCPWCRGFLCRGCVGSFLEPAVFWIWLGGCCIDAECEGLLILTPTYQVSRQERKIVTDTY